MPTSRRRHAITETDAVARAIDAAARRWPDLADNRSRLLVRLIEAGHGTLITAEAAEIRRRLEAIGAGAGALSGSYPDDYLDDLRGDWPT